jgi:hypothetical protein
MEAAEKAYDIEKYDSAKMLADEVGTILSDDFQAKVLAHRKELADKAEAEAARIAEAKAAEAAAAEAAEAKAAAAKAAAKADAATTMNEAQTRMTWANEVGLRNDYPDEYQTASTSMAEAFTSYVNQDYAIAKANAGFVNATLNDDFQAMVNEERKAAKEEAFRMAAYKAASEPAMADARTRMAWAENNELAKDHPAEYKKADAAMEAAEKAYDIEKYDSAKMLADEVGTILSDDFQAKVLTHRKELADKAEAEAARIAEEKAKAEAEAARAAEEKAKAEAEAAQAAAEKAKAEAEAARAAAEKAKAEAAAAAAKAAAAKAAAKADADKTMDDAQARMAWANEVGIKSDYPSEYQTASMSMIAAFTTYGNEDYASAKANASFVNATLNDDFQAMVNAERKAAEEEAAKLKADKAASEPAMADARNRMAWAENNELAKDHPAEYKSANAAMEAAEKAYEIEKYESAKLLADEVGTMLSNDFQAKVLAERQQKFLKAEADASINAANKRMDWASDNGIKADYLDEFQSASQDMLAAFSAYGKKDYSLAKEKADLASATLSDDFQARVKAERKAKADEEARIAREKARSAAEADLKKAQDRYNWAVSVNAMTNYPVALANASTKLSIANAMFAAGDYPNTTKKANEAYEALAGVQDFAPLPAVYVVRLIPERRDCLWRIAEYSFIYNNPLKWPVLYEANKKTFRDPSNPNLIYPGQVLVIPSIKGEVREGTWDPKKIYKPLAK